MKYTALYCRVSTDRQAEEGYSIEAQQESLVHFCKSRKIKNYKFYIDAGWSGSNLNRPEIQGLICDITEKKIDSVVVFKLDRLSRSQKDTMYLLEDIFIPNKVGFVSITESFDTSTPTGMAFIGLLSVFSQLERSNIKLRTRSGMQKRIEKGYWMGGGRVPYGYDYDKNSGILVPNNDADRVKKAYEMYLDGISPNKISIALGFKNERIVTQILKRKSNCGYIIYNGKEYKGRHKAIIDLETYEKTREMLVSKSVNRTESNFLLTGLLICGKCGAKMRYQKWGKSGYKIHCYSQQSSKKYLIKDPNCDNIKYWAKDVESIVINNIFNLSYEYKKKLPSIENDLEETLKKQYDRVYSEISRLYKLYARDENEILLHTIDDLKKDLKKIEEEIVKEKNQKEISNKIRENFKIVENLSDAWDYMTEKEKQTAVRCLVDHIILNDEKIDIHYKLEEYFKD